MQILWDMPKIMSKTINIIRARGTDTIGLVMEAAAAGGNVMEAMAETAVGAININASEGVRLISTLGTVVGMLEPQQFNSVVVLNGISTFSSYMLSYILDRGTVNGMMFGFANNILVPINLPPANDPRRRTTRIPRAQAPSPQQMPIPIPVPVPIPGIPVVVNPAPSTPIQVVANSLRYNTPVSAVSPGYSPVSPAYNPVARELDVADYDSELMEVTVVS